MKPKITAWAFWLAPAIAAAMLGYVVTTWLAHWWLTDGRQTEHTTPGLTSRASEIFPSVKLDSPAAKAVVAVPNDWRVVGTALPAKGEPAKALLRVGGKAFTINEGEALPGGGTLLRIGAREVDLVDARGEKVTVKLATSGNAPTTAGVSSATSVLGARVSDRETVAAQNSSSGNGRIQFTAGCTASPAQKSRGVVLNLELIAGALQNQSSFAAMFNTQGGKLTVQNSAGIGALIGLREGDVLRAADGKRINGVADIVPNILTPLTEAKAVAVEIERNSAPLVLTYLPPGCKN